jgi:hypothetical protein
MTLTLCEKLISAELPDDLVIGSNLLPVPSVGSNQTRRMER